MTGLAVDGWGRFEHRTKELRQTEASFLGGTAQCERAHRGYKWRTLRVALYRA